MAVDDVALRLSVLDGIADGLMLVALDGTCQWANPAFGELVRLDPADVAGSPVQRFAADEQGLTDLEGFLAETARGTPPAGNFEVLLGRADGSAVWTLVRWDPVHDADGALVGYLHRFTEYAERRRLHDELLVREQQLATAQRLAKVGGWSWIIATDRMTWTVPERQVDALRGEHDAVHVEGISYQQFLGQIHPDDRARVSATVLDGMRQQDAFDWEARLVLPDGSLQWVHILAEVTRDDAGVVVRLDGTARDVTEMRTADRAAHDARRRMALLQRMAEAANRSTTVADALVRAAEAMRRGSDWLPVCVFVRASRGAPLTFQELPERRPSDLPSPDAEAAAECWRTRRTVVRTIAGRSGRPERSMVSLPILTGAGMACVVQVLADDATVDDATWTLLQQVGDVLGRVAERERAARQLAEARDEAMRASRHKSEFVATMSHEIRTPMNGVIGLTELLLRTPLDGQQQRLADGLRTAGLTLLGLINDVLDISKIESGKLEIEETEFDPRTVVDDVALVLARPAQEKGLELVVACTPEVPARLVGDPVRLGQVIANLGSNAVKFTETGEVVVELSASRVPGTPQHSDEVLLDVEVRDTGIGIEESDLEGLFDAFTQADRSATRRHGGTGLGLAISEQLVEMMNGTMGVESRPGEGSTFRFTARVRRAPDGPASTTSELWSVADAPRRVLVVDPHATAARFLGRQLAAWSIGSDRARDGREALTALTDAAAAGAAYDVALIDLDLPDLGALELARRVRRDPALADTRLVLVTEEGGVAGDDPAEAGFAGLLTKPVRHGPLQEQLLRPRRSAPLASVPPTPLGPPAGGSSAEAAADASTRAPAATHGRDRPALGLHVLVVEDNAVNQLVAIGLLEDVGCTARAVDNGAEAVTALGRGHPYDLVLMDCRMPRLDGFDATRAIRASEPEGVQVPIVAMTASALPGERARCLDAGMDDFLTKPVDPRQLSRTLRRVAAGLPLAAAVAAGSTASATDGAAVVTSPPPDAPPVLDADRVEMLHELVKDGVSFFERTRASFLARVDGSLAHLSIALEEGEVDQVVHDAHQLRGSALNIGLARVGAAAEALEEHARVGDLTEAPALLAALRVEVAEGVSALASAGDPA